MFPTRRHAHSNLGLHHDLQFGLLQLQSVQDPPETRLHALHVLALVCRPCHCHVLLSRLQGQRQRCSSLLIHLRPPSQPDLSTIGHKCLFQWLRQVTNEKAKTHTVNSRLIWPWDSMKLISRLIRPTMLIK